MKKIIFWTTIALLTSLGFSCTSIKPYERAKLNDRDMQFSGKDIKKWEIYVISVREGASGGVPANDSGGCGCN